MLYERLVQVPWNQAACCSAATSVNIPARAFPRSCSSTLRRGCADLDQRFPGSRWAVDTLLTTPEQHRNLLGLIFWLDLPRTEIPFEPGKRSVGVSKSSLHNHCKRGIDTVFATSRRPCRHATGVLLLAIGVLLVLWFPLQSLLRPDTVWFSWCYLIVLVHIVGGSVLCGIGVLGAYLVRVLEQVKQRPLYVLKYDSKASVPKVLPFAPTGHLAA